MTFEHLDSAFCNVMSMDVKWGEFNGATIAAYYGFEFVQSLIVEDVPIYDDDLRVFPVLVDGLVGFNEIIGCECFIHLVLMQLPSSLTANMLYFWPWRDMMGKLPVWSVHMDFFGH